MKRQAIRGALNLSYYGIKRAIFGTKYIAEVDVTDNCNLRCKHCYHFHGKDKFERKELPLSTWEKRFKSLYEDGIRFILLVGGEPALRNDVLMLANKIFPYIYVITNGTIKIPKSFNHRLFVSIDGVESTNDNIRGKGTFSKVLEKYYQDKRVIINMTIAKNNYKELEDVVKLSIANGFTGVVCNLFTPPLRGYKSNFFIEKNTRKKIISKLKRVKSLYPDDFLLSKEMISWYETADHRAKCHWGDEAIHYDVFWNKRRCFNNNADCSNCGCFAGAIQNPLKIFLHPKEMLRIGILDSS